MSDEQPMSAADYKARADATRRENEAADRLEWQQAVCATCGNSSYCTCPPEVVHADLAAQYATLLPGSHVPVCPEPVNGELLAAVQKLATDLRAQDAATGLNKRGLDWIARAESAIAHAASLPVVDVARWRDALERIATAQQQWTEGVGSYAGGETNAGFAARLQELARAALAPVQS